ncbi:MAG: Gldg family protein [Acidobacteriota bacterium]
MSDPHTDKSVEETTATRRQGSPVPTVWIGVILAVLVFVGVNYLGMRHWQRLDWTASQLYTLSDKSRAVAAELDRDVEIVMITTAPDEELARAIVELLERYRGASDRITTDVIDPARDLLAAQDLMARHGVERSEVIVVAAGDDRRVLDLSEVADVDLSGVQMGEAPRLRAFQGEQVITGALLDLAEPEQRRILFVSGHGEASPEAIDRRMSAVAELLGRDNFAYATWGSLGAERVPANTDLVIVAGPTSGITAPELAVFDRYLEAGGRMLILVDPPLSATGALATSTLVDWLATWGVALGTDIVIDPNQRLPIYGPETVFTDNWGNHPVVETLAVIGDPVLFPAARSVRPADSERAGLEIVPLVRSSLESWAETDLETLASIAYDEDAGDLAGPVPLAVAVERTIDPTPVSDPVPVVDPVPTANEPSPVGEETDVAASAAESVDPEPVRRTRMIVFGDFDFASDRAIVNVANAALLLNSLNWLVERERLLAIPPREPEMTQLLLGWGELSTLLAVVVLFLPGLAAMTGVWVWMRRRR